MATVYEVIKQVERIQRRVTAIAEDLPQVTLEELGAALDSFEEILEEAEEVADKANEEDEDAA